MSSKWKFHLKTIRFNSRYYQESLFQPPVLVALI